MNRVVIIAGGSFSGKSIVSLAVAVRLRFSGVLTTDMVRNIIKVNSPESAHLSSSTYLLPASLFDRQQEEVCQVVKKVLGIYASRGEHMIVEGMHFTDDFLKWSTSQGFCGIFLWNTLPWRKRVLLKKVTRNRFHFTDGSKDHFAELDENNVDSSNYLRFGERVLEIEEKLRRTCESSGFRVIQYQDINRAIECVISNVKKWPWQRP